VYESVRTIEENHYDTLGLKFRSFTQKQVKTNFRKASLQYHPDKAGQTGAGMCEVVNEEGGKENAQGGEGRSRRATETEGTHLLQDKIENEV
jgi:hypothetical protein